jgi:tetratricopeptide (TPR) repeat protein
MKKTFTLIFTTILLHCVHAQTIESGINLLRKEKFEQAKKELLALQGSDKANLASFYLGNLFLRTGKTDSARIFFSKASSGTDAFAYLAQARIALMDKKDSLTVYPLVDNAISSSRRKNAEVYFQAGYLGYQTLAVTPSKHIDYMSQAIRMEPTNAYYQMALGDFYQDMKQGGKAMTEYENAQYKEPNNVQVNIRIGSLLYAATNYEKAIAALEKANSIDSGFSQVHKELGELYYLTRQYQKSSAEFKKYVEMNKNDNKARLSYSGFLFQLKDYEKASDEVNQLVKTADSTNYVYYRILAFSNYEMKKYPEAQVSMNKFWKYIGTNEVTGLDYSYAGRIASANNDTANAIKYLRTSVKLDSNNTDLQSEYAKVLFNTKRYQESINEYKKRMKMDKSAGSLDYYYLGRAYYAHGQFLNADTAFAEFVAQQPNSPDGYLWRAKSLLELDKTTLKGLASEQYLKFIEIGSNDMARNKSNIISAYNYLGFVALTAKDKVKAKEYFNKILEIDPGNKNATEELSKIK